MTVTFFGHRNTTSEVSVALHEVLIDLIENKNADTFYVGNHGNFDKMVRKELKKLKEIYPHINYSVVLAYLGKKQEDENYSDTIYPDGLEKVPMRYAINHRNRWMLERSSFVITYPSLLGNSLKLAAKARLSGKTVIDISREAEDLFPLR